MEDLINLYKQRDNKVPRDLSNELVDNPHTRIVALTDNINGIIKRAVNEIIHGLSVLIYCKDMAEEIYNGILNNIPNEYLVVARKNNLDNRIELKNHGRVRILTSNGRRFLCGARADDIILYDPVNTTQGEFDTFYAITFELASIKFLVVGLPSSGDDILHRCINEGWQVYE